MSETGRPAESPADQEAKSGRPADGGEEGVPGVGRVEAFSDGVIAIIITIMVLELKAPEEHGLQHLWRLWPIAIAYALSFAYVGIYWVNHHRLFSHATRVTNGLIWWNLLLLFTLSLVPFSTAYLGEQLFTKEATVVYLVTMMLPSLAWPPLQHIIRNTGLKTDKSAEYHRLLIRKAVFAVVIYVVGIAASFVSPVIGIASAGLVAFLWFLPKHPVDHWFAKASEPKA